jgi:hypothetical protein
MSNFFLNIETVKDRYRAYISSCATVDKEFRLTSISDVSPYALCFAIFGYWLIKDLKTLDKFGDHWSDLLQKSLYEYYSRRNNFAVDSYDKPYLQLLTFTLSALQILGKLDKVDLSKFILEFLPKDIDLTLIKNKVLIGSPTTGNYAMFLAVLLIHARDFLGINTQPLINRWEELHLSAINKFGFWGCAESMSYLQFQNGYHQYEIFEYLKTGGVPWQLAAQSVASLADHEGHFSPYIGGGGCYDYDAVFILTSDPYSVNKHANLLLRTARSLLSSQNEDGGFCESKRIRPRSISNFLASANHVLTGKGIARKERLYKMLTLLRPKHDRIQTHWTNYSREWSESNLWDSWFRMLAIARIDVALNPENAKNWGFINYPGIGFNECARV